ncbi:MAG TPA: MCE family protein [Pseudonocardia sp.]|uniref:MCE family protein n=1 Tax=Pseudonocardia sp. TaxID=60912 RepID=UPI002CE8718A|nr:MCE family protein [Pseudonocardia sp.]HTF49627.1 MCE family protein [Pseudonocardia sp.]
MIWYTRAERPRYVLLGVLFLVLAVGFVALSVGIYRKVFTPVDLVMLRVERTGTQLNPGADVKVRGVRVGSVRSVDATAAGATITLALDPNSMALVPANVSARVLPKTLFGERYVDLRLPKLPAAPIAAGDVIPEDRSQSAIEVQQVLDHLLPTLTAVQPAQLATTLSALSQALHGQGTQLGATLVGLDSYLKGFNPAVPDLIKVLDDLSPVADTYAKAAPDFFGGLADLTTTTQTVADKRDQLRRLFLGVTHTSDDLRHYLDDNADNLVDLSSSARPALELLARYSPELPCFFRQVVDGIPRADASFGKGSAHPEQVKVQIEITASRGKYLPGVDTPRYEDRRGPRCYDQAPVFPQYAPGGPLKDGSRKPAAPDSDQADLLAGLLPLAGDGTYGDARTDDTIADGSGEPDGASGLLMVPFIGDRPGVPTEQPHPATPLEGPR